MIIESPAKSYRNDKCQKLENDLKMKRKKIFLTSGFGNNMFQLDYMNDKNISAAISLLERNNFLNTYITKFSVHNNFMISNLNTQLPTIGDYIVLCILFFKKKHLKEENVSFTFMNITWTFGYFQNNFKGSYYTEKLYLELLQKYEIKCSEDTSNYGVIHFRRGDFTNGGRVIELKYYQDAVNYIINKNVNIDKFYVIGLDDEVELELLDESFTYEQHNGSEIGDIEIMHNAKIVISSNSTFAMWPTLYGNATLKFFPKEILKDVCHLGEISPSVGEMIIL